MKDGKEGIAKAINDYEFSEQMRTNDKAFTLTKEEKEMIEYGYIQCMLHIGYDIGTKGESFIVGLQELSKFESFIEEGYTEESLREKIRTLRLENIKLLQESL